MCSMRTSDITITIELRPCLANGKKALFHKWIKEFSDFDYASESGWTEKVYGLIEYEDGTLGKVNYENIQFVDEKIRGYYFRSDYNG